MSDARAWVTSSYSATGNCVEVAVRGDVLVLARDTKDRPGPVLAFRSEAWRRFVDQVKGEHA